MYSEGQFAMALLPFLIALVLPGIVIALEVSELLLAHEETTFFNKTDEVLEWTFSYDVITIQIKEIEKNQYTWYWTHEEPNFKAWGGGWTIPGMNISWYNISTPSKNKFDYHIETTSVEPIEFHKRFWNYSQGGHRWRYHLIDSSNMKLLLFSIDQFHFNTRVQNIVLIEPPQPTIMSRFYYRRPVKEMPRNDIEQELRRFRRDTEWDQQTDQEEGEESFIKKTVSRFAKVLKKLGQKFHEGFKGGQDVAAKNEEEDPNPEEASGLSKLLYKFISIMGHVTGAIHGFVTGKHQEEST